MICSTDFSDFSLGSFPWAKRLAAILDAELHIIYVVEEPVVYGSLNMTAPPLPTVAELKEAASNHLDSFMSENFGASDNDVTGTVLVGRPAEEIVQYATNHAAEMIVMSTHVHRKNNERR
ncbi:MAG: hypothetical protein CL799_02470 [Chromatiales bacterium]|nr:hypothetical protein [Chromatiales bacterium]